MRMRLATLLLRTVLAALAGLGCVAHAADFPSRTVTIIVPTPPGGPMDLAARLVAPILQKRWGQSVVVDNRPGAGALLGVNLLVRAQPDGHTLLVHNNAVATYKLFYKDLAWNPERDIAPLTKVMSTPYVVAVNEQVPAKTLGALFAYARANPGKLNFAVIPNSPQDLETFRLFQREGVKVTRIPYNGAAPVTRALLANDVQVYLGGPLGLMPQFAAGKLLPLAVASADRLEALPSVPTVKSTGIDYEAGVWYGFFTHAGAPREVIAKLAADLRSALADPEVQAQIRAQGYDPATSTPDELGRAMAAEVAEMTKIARDANVQPQ